MKKKKNIQQELYSEKYQVFIKVEKKESIHVWTVQQNNLFLQIYLSAKWVVG